jgi:hypothetical protein
MNSIHFKQECFSFVQHFHSANNERSKWTGVKNGYESIGATTGEAAPAG